MEQNRIILRSKVTIPGDVGLDDIDRVHEMLRGYGVAGVRFADRAIDFDIDVADTAGRAGAVEPWMSHLAVEVLDPTNGLPSTSRERMGFEVLAVTTAVGAVWREIHDLLRVAGFPDAQAPEVVVVACGGESHAAS